MASGETQILNSNSKTGVQDPRCPVLLFILCLLVQHDQIAVKMKNNSFGEVYAIMIRLYVKYQKRKGITFHVSQFVEVMKKVGKQECIPVGCVPPAHRPSTGGYIVPGGT